MNLFSFQRIRNRVFVNFFGIKFKYTSFNNFGKYRKPDYRYIIDLVSEISGKEVKNIDDRKIYVIGDSHSVFFCGQDFLSYKKLKNGITTACCALKPFKNYHLGACLAYNTTNENAGVNSLKKTKFMLENGWLPENSAVVISFGEIDIRVHLLKRAEKTSLDTEIDKILANYLQYIKMLQRHNLRVIVWGPVASQNDDCPKDELLPSYGSEYERNYATKVFNEKLERLAKENDFIFCSIFKYLVDDSLHSKTGYYVDGYHLGTKALPFMVREFLEKGVFAVENDKVKILNF